MNKILFLLAVLCVSFYGHSQKAPQAIITFETETIDYGVIAQDSDGTRTFVFTNTGDSPLIIEDVRSSCGCTIPKKPESPIAPGERGEIQVKYDTHRVGVFRKTITVRSNASEKPVVALKIKGTVEAEKVEK